MVSPSIQEAAPRASMPPFLELGRRWFPRLLGVHGPKPSSSIDAARTSHGRRTDIRLAAKGTSAGVSGA